MPKKFVRNVLKLLPGHHHVKNIFYIGQVNDVVFGYSYERLSSGVQCYLYNFPLFLKSQILHLDYSVRIPYPSGEIPITNAMEKKFLGVERKYNSWDDEQVASEFVRICQEFRDTKFRYEANLDGFIQRILEQSKSGYSGPLPPLMIDNSKRLYSLAAAFAIKGDRDLAIADLEMFFDKVALDKRIDTKTQVYSVDAGGAKGEMNIVPLHHEGAISESKENPLLNDARQLYALLRENGDAAIKWLKAIEETNKVAFKLK